MLCYAMNAHMTIDDAAITPRILKAATALGVFGSSAMSAPRILAALCNPATGVAEVSALIRQEPGLAVRVLRVANSAFYGVSRSVTTMERALLVLGLDSVRGIAAAACLDRSVMHTPETAAINRHGFVLHSLATGVAAEALARIRHRPLASEAFIAGLLHNFGVPVQALLDPSAVRAMIAALAADPSQDIRALEERLGVPGHERCVAVIFESWQLPASLAGAVACHHAPQAASEYHRNLASLLHLGMQLAQASGHRCPLERVLAVRSESAMQRLGLTDADLDGVQDALPERLGQLQQALAGI
jgi:HD-like signal output (HDOD) protein